MDKLRDRMRRAKEQDAIDVERLYSTKPIEVELGHRLYRIPVNFMSPKGENEPSMVRVRKVQFVMFLPDFIGFTKDNWADPFDRGRITVDELSYEKSERTDKERFEALKPLLEDQPSIRQHGLEGYFFRNRDNKGVYWVGYRSDSSFLYFRTTRAPGEVSHTAPRFPLCDVRYHSDAEGMYIVYRYAMENIHRWRAIDDGIWARIREWRVDK